MRHDRGIAASATTQVMINLEDVVNGGSVTTKGNAQIYIDSATITCASLMTTAPIPRSASTAAILRRWSAPQ